MTINELGYLDHLDDAQMMEFVADFMDFIYKDTIDNFEHKPISDTTRQEMCHLLNVKLMEFYEHHKIEPVIEPVVNQVYIERYGLHTGGECWHIKFDDYEIHGLISFNGAQQ